MLRDQLQRAARLAEQAAADIAALRQQLLAQPVISAKASRLVHGKRKHRSCTADLHDQMVYTSEQMTDYLHVHFVAWSTDEDASTIGVACIEAVLTLLNRLQRTSNPHVCCLTSSSAWRRSVRTILCTSGVWTSTLPRSATWWHPSPSTPTTGP